MNRNIEIQNDLWQATVSGSSGDVIQLLDVRQQAERVLAKPLKADTVLEGGLHRPPGLSLWVKTGNEPDHNTAVLSEFAAGHNAPRNANRPPIHCPVFLPNVCCRSGSCITRRVRELQRPRCGGRSEPIRGS